MRKTTIDGMQAFTGRVLRCPMCGHWMVKAPGLFGKLIMIDGDCECGYCGTKIIFGDQERLNAMAEDVEKETAEAKDCFNCNHNVGPTALNEGNETCNACLQEVDLPNWEAATE